MSNQKHGIPSLVSLFIPGLGQLIKGDFIKGIMIWILGGVAVIFLWWTVIVPLIIYIWNVYDAYNSN
ncbi:hypothetical protein JYB64_13305 [Algoriphagus aestuarii]|nr:hypothetical protein [Algoriphagus aestuarii]